MMKDLSEHYLLTNINLGNDSCSLSARCTAIITSLAMHKGVNIFLLIQILSFENKFFPDALLLWNYLRKVGQWPKVSRGHISHISYHVGGRRVLSGVCIPHTIHLGDTGGSSWSGSVWGGVGRRGRRGWGVCKSPSVPTDVRHHNWHQM